ncbi:MAG: TetR/AcrR family transcriptional regulator [Caldilineaceae bacterium]
MKEADLRVQRTRRRLREAFIALVVVAGYEGVTVLDIVKRAGVGHKTFYRHYANKEALLADLLAEILAEVQTVLLPPTAPHAPEENTLNALRFVHKYADLSRALLRSPVAEQLVQPMIVFALAEGERFFGGRDTPGELVAYHFATGLLSLIRWWLEHDMPYPPEEMADYVNRLLIQPIQNLA